MTARGAAPSGATAPALPPVIAEVVSQLTVEERQQIAGMVGGVNPDQLAGIARTLGNLPTPEARLQWARAQLGMRPSSPALCEVCRDIVAGLEGGLACAVVDLGSGALLGAHNKVTGRTSIHEATVSGLVDMFRGPAVTRVAQLVRMQRGVPENGEHYFEEIQIISRHNLHFASVLGSGDQAVMLIAMRSSSLDEGWRLVRHHVPRMAAILRDPSRSI